MILLIKLDRLVHRMMRGRCWNRRACLWLSHYAALRDAKEQ